MITVPTIGSQDALDELGRLINDACENGDTVTAIAIRAGIDRKFVSSLRNGTYHSSPTLDKVVVVLDAIGGELVVRRKKKS